MSTTAPPPDDDLGPDDVPPVVIEPAEDDGAVEGEIYDQAPPAEGAVTRTYVATRGRGTGVDRAPRAGPSVVTTGSWKARAASSPATAR